MPKRVCFGSQYLLVKSLKDGVTSGLSILSMLYISTGFDNTGVPDKRITLFAAERIGTNSLDLCESLDFR